MGLYQNAVGESGTGLGPCIIIAAKGEAQPLGYHPDVKSGESFSSIRLKVVELSKNIWTRNS